MGAVNEVDTGCRELLCRVEERVAVLTLNRPEARNALTWDMKAALVEQVPRLGADPEVGCLLLTGAGQAFCAGGDTKNMAKEGRPPSPQERMRILRWEHALPEAIHRLEKPVVCALPGPAAGAGLGIALACDLRIMAESAFVTTAYARLGLSGDYGASWFLTQLVGTAKARELFFTGDRVDAAECERLGIANRVVPDADLEKESLALAQRIAAGPPQALRWMKDTLNRALREDLPSILELEADRMVLSAQTDDYLEAVKAFQEKRAPVFKGR
ncbi:MAG: enoyl-CoA hydratase [Myxococcota bacterium]